MYDRPTQVNPLPPVDSYVIIHELHIFERARGNDHVWTTYVPADGKFADPWAVPKVFRVCSYSKGIDNALDTHNELKLEWTAPCGVIETITVRAYLIATGSMFAEIITDDRIPHKKGEICEHA